MVGENFFLNSRVEKLLRYVAITRLSRFRRSLAGDTWLVSLIDKSLFSAPGMLCVYIMQHYASVIDYHDVCLQCLGNIHILRHQVGKKRGEGSLQC